MHIPEIIYSNLNSIPKSDFWEDVLEYNDHYLWIEAMKGSRETQMFVTAQSDRLKEEVVNYGDEATADWVAWRESLGIRGLDALRVRGYKDIIQKLQIWRNLAYRDGFTYLVAKYEAQQGFGYTTWDDIIGGVGYMKFRDFGYMIGIHKFPSAGRMAADFRVAGHLATQAQKIFSYQVVVKDEGVQTESDLVENDEEDLKTPLLVVPVPIGGMVEVLRSLGFKDVKEAEIDDDRIDRINRKLNSLNVDPSLHSMSNQHANKDDQSMVWKPTKDALEAAMVGLADWLPEDDSLQTGEPQYEEENEELGEDTLAGFYD